MNESAAMKFVLCFSFVMLSATKHLNTKEMRFFAAYDSAQNDAYSN